MAIWWRIVRLLILAAGIGIAFYFFDGWMEYIGFIVFATIITIVLDKFEDRNKMIADK
ncbi:hypothetical protein [Virgibacillus halodenitrificans]|uniref:hypothetical protein n=1 Tax=Virgibacillus halodenitrificans TaxID=1482 RepID=UPI0002D25E8A|nr:hypothetical protein [Virgibacillus halodenitrificans]